jgi:periplasmic divalent cation tolerance protein
MCDARLIVTTVDSAEAARTLATGLVEDRLAACVNLVPGVQSIYRWQGAVESAAEWLLFVKTTAAQVEDCLKALTERHPYDVPEGLVFDATGGLPAYLSWVDESVGETGRQ